MRVEPDSGRRSLPSTQFPSRIFSCIELRPDDGPNEGDFMASAEKGSSRSAGRSSSGSKTKRGKNSSGKPSSPRSLHSSARKQTTAVARGGAGQKASKKASSSGTVPGRKATTPAKKGGALRTVGKAVRSVAKKVSSALKPRKGSPASAAKPSPRVTAPERTQKPRTTRRASDVDSSKLDEVSGQTSSKGPFDSKRSDAFRQQDIDSAFANRNEEWADEDHLTNRSGNKRIGTKNRKYE